MNSHLVSLACKSSSLPLFRLIFPSYSSSFAAEVHRTPSRHMQKCHEEAARPGCVNYGDLRVREIKKKKMTLNNLFRWLWFGPRRLFLLPSRQIHYWSLCLLRVTLFFFFPPQRDVLAVLLQRLGPVAKHASRNMQSRRFDKLRDKR